MYSKIITVQTSVTTSTLALLLKLMTNMVTFKGKEFQLQLKIGKLRDTLSDDKQQMTQKPLQHRDILKHGQQQTMTRIQNNNQSIVITI